MRLERGDAVGLARALIRTDSRNPSLVPGGPGEGHVAAVLRGVLDAWGFRVELQDVAPGRPNVVARIGTPGPHALMFNGHLDVVGVDGMTHAPFAADERDGRLYGRGSSDMKAGVAAMCAARALVAAGIRADAAVVTEPTGLAIMPAHRGFVWVDLVFHGRAAHGSRWDLGVDAIRHAGLVLAELDALDADELTRHTHRLLGHASLHASLIAGGTGM